jgi:acyl-coenzyme A synthetase/AMP-(fatty) acid ligase
MKEGEQGPNTYDLFRCGPGFGGEPLNPEAFDGVLPSHRKKKCPIVIPWQTETAST